MSIRVATSSLIAGALVCGNRGLGVLGSAVPGAGDQGASYLYNDLALPADANKEVRGQIVSPPTGALFANEDGSFVYTGPASSFGYQLFVDGADLGTAVATLADPSSVASGALAAVESGADTFSAFASSSPAPAVAILAAVESGADSFYATTAASASVIAPTLPSWDNAVYIMGYGLMTSARRGTVGPWTVWRFGKHPQEVLDYDVVYAGFFSSRTDDILSISVVADPGITVESSVLSGKVFKIVISGGVLWAKYRVTVVMVTTSGIVKFDEFWVVML